MFEALVTRAYVVDSDYKMQTSVVKDSNISLKRKKTKNNAREIDEEGTL